MTSLGSSQNRTSAGQFRDRQNPDGKNSRREEILPRLGVLRLSHNCRYKGFGTVGQPENRGAQSSNAPGTA
jgi:hypothetical protein